MEIDGDSNQNIYHEIMKDDTEYKYNDVTNEPKSFGFHTATKNVRISAVFIKSVWKRRGRITQYVRKKTFKSKTKGKHGTKSKVRVKKEQIIHPTEFTGDRKWCWDEFEQHIGVPHKTDLNPSLVITWAKAKTLQRFVPEAKKLRKPVNTNTLYLTSMQPIKNCICPDHNCLCVGNTVINRNQKIPKNYKSKWNPAWIKNLMIGVCLKRVDLKKNAFMIKMIQLTRGSIEQEEETYNDQTLGEDLCITRCRNCLVTGKLREATYLPDFLSELPTEKKKPVAEVADEKNLEKFKVQVSDDRICNVVFCSVSTQTQNQRDGTLLTGPFTHLLYSNNEKTYLPDTRGKKLLITRYTHVSPKGPDLQVCERNMEKLLDFKEMKTRLSKLISSIYVIKDPGAPVQNSSTQVPWRKRICDLHDICPTMKPPNRCGDEDYDNLPKVPWTVKMQEFISEQTKKDELEEDEMNAEHDRCPCCELFVKSDIDKVALLQDMRNILSLPGDVTISNNQLEKDEKISDVNIIIEEVVANTFDDIDENIKKEVKIMEAGCKGNKKSDHHQKEKDSTEVKQEGNKNIINTEKNVKEIEKNVISNENINGKESVDKNISNTKEMITENDDYKLNNLLNSGNASQKIATETGNNKERIICDDLKPKKPNLLSSSKTIKPKKSELLAMNENGKIMNVMSNFNTYNSETHIENDNNGMGINHVLQESEQGKQELSKELSNTTKLTKKSSIKNSKTLMEQTVASNIQNASNKIVLQMNTSYKKASSAFSSLFKWLYGQSIQMSQFNKTLSAKSISKGKYSTDDSHLNEKVSKNSEKEVFSFRYTSSTISVNKSTSSGVENN